MSPRERFYYARELAAHGRDREAAAGLEGFLGEEGAWAENKLQACRDLAGCYRRLGEGEKAFAALAKALEYGPPRAELCCDLGQFFLDRGEYPAAVFWYEAALSRPREDRAGGFVLPDCYGYIPCMQLCLCHYRMGHLELARQYNCRAGAFKPDDPAFLYNERFSGGRPSPALFGKLCPSPGWGLVFLGEKGYYKGDRVTLLEGRLPYDPTHRPV